MISWGNYHILISYFFLISGRNVYQYDMGIFVNKELKP